MTLPQRSQSDSHERQIAANRAARQLVEQMGRTAAIDAVAQMYGYKETPPTITQVIDDPFYLGQMLGDKLYPTWRAGLQEIFPDPFFSPYIEVATCGAIGTGKSTLSLSGLFYDLIRLLHLKDPHNTFSLVKSTRIFFAFINATLSLSTGVLYNQAMEFISVSPFFKSLVNTKNRSTMALFPASNIDFITGSRFGHLLGSACVGVILSELNFMDRVADQAVESYTHAKRRIQSRFLQSGGYLPSRIWLDSSASDETGFLTTHLEKCATDPMVKVFSYPLWEVKKHLNIYSGKTFKVFIGNATRDPFVVKYPEQTYGLDEYIIDVPIEHEREFDRDIVNSLRDIAGKTVWASQTFISSKEKIQNALCLESPVLRTVIELDFFDPNDKLIDYVDFYKIKQDSRPRFMHIDLGLKNDKTGLAFTRIDGWIESQGVDPATGRSTKMMEPVFYVDMVFCIASKGGQEVPIYKIKELIIDLIARGYPIACVTTDGFQSSNLRQDLTYSGIDTELLSVDKKRFPYERMKAAIMEGRLFAPNHPILKEELEGLIDRTKKIDHQSSGSKDIADALAGSIYQCFTKADKYMASVRSEEYLNVLEKQSVPDNFYKEVAAFGSVVSEYDAFSHSDY